MLRAMPAMPSLKPRNGKKTRRMLRDEVERAET